MKKHSHRFTLSAIIVYLTCAILNPAVAATHPLWENGTHFCGVIDGQWNKRHSDQFHNRHYARTFAANLNVGEPRTVRMIYFLPNDRPYQAEVVQKMKDEIRTVQTFFAEQMEAHGYGRRTFRVETDAQGEPIVHRVVGQHSDRYYRNNTARPVESEIRQKFSIFSNIYFIVIDNSIDAIGRGDRYTVGVGGRGGKNGGYALVPSGFEWEVAAHELGHAFGLEHNFNDDTYIMSYGGTARNRLSLCSAEFLSVHTYFNFDIPIEKEEPPTIELISPSTYPPGSQSVPVQLKVSDSEGLHQVLLFTSVKFSTPGTGFYEFKECQTLANKREEVIEFLYDGVIPSVPGSSLSRPSAHFIHVEAIDTDGNVSEIDEVISASVLEVDIPDEALRAVIEKSLGKSLGARITTADMQKLTRLEARRDDISDLTGLEFASNLRSLTLNEQQISNISPLVTLAGLQWLDLGNNQISDVSPLTHVEQLEGLILWGNQITDINPLRDLIRLKTLYLGDNQVSDISALANLTRLETLVLSDSQISDISPLANLTRLEDLRLRYNQISNITPLANLTRLEELSLWGNQIADISPLAALTRLRTLNLHNNQVSDISALANLTRLEWLDLWDNQVNDISSLANLTQLEGLNLWDNQVNNISSLANLTRLETLRLGTNQITDIAAFEGLVNLTQLSLERNNISDISPLVVNTALEEGDEVNVGRNPLSYQSIHIHIPALQSRGAIVEFDNQAHPAILKISGDNQSGASLVSLSQPFIVEAQDANGSVLGGISVTFAVTAGGGTLSTTTMRTDRNGRAQTTLRLGPNLGANTVQVSAAGIEVPATFHAVSDMEAPPTIADVNSDGSVNVLDLLMIASSLGQSGQNDADVNGDGVITVLDLVMVAGLFDVAAAAPSAQPQVPETLTAVEVQSWLTDARSLETRNLIMKRGFLVLEQLLVSLTPKETELLANYPNPFNPETWIPYRLAEDTFVTLTIYDLSGQVVRTLDVGYRIASAYENRSKAIYWDGRNDLGEGVASGIYFYTLSAGDHSATRKMLILK